MHEFQSRAVLQALASLKRWSKEPDNNRASDVFTTQLWRSHIGHSERALLRTEKWAELKSVRERALYISRSLGHHKQPRVTTSMVKLCPRSSGKIEVLTEVQAVASRLMTPGGPIRRLILQIPPGSGKTCTYLSEAAQFLGNGHTIVIVGDDDVFSVFKEGLRQCPARVQRRMVGPDGKSVPSETVYLRDINAHMSAFCTMKSGASPNLQGSPFTCDSDAFSWIDTRVYFFDFVMAGNWMQAWSERRTNAKGQAVKSMYHEVNPFSSKLLLIVDEAHKLTVPSMEQTTERWKVAAALFPKYMASLGKDKSSNPYILAGTATVNTTQMPTLSLCLPRVVKGFTDPVLYLDDDVGKPPRLNLHTYLLPSSGFVRSAREVALMSFPPVGLVAETALVPISQLKERLEKYKGFGQDEAASKRYAKKENGADHPCPVSARALREASYEIFEPIDTEENRRRLLEIWSGVVYIVDTSQDYRYYPTTNNPYPTIRTVAVPGGERGEEFLKLLEKPKGALARWTEVSQFADQTILQNLVQSCLDGEPLDLALVEFMAPKWRAVAEDLTTDPRLRGRTMIYPGAYNRKGCDDNYYLLLLAFYLQAKLRPYVRRHCSAKEHQLITVESALRSSGEEARSDAPAIYIIGDSAEGKYLQREITSRLRAVEAALEDGRRPRAEDFVLALSTRAFRERQYNRYNEERCPGPSHVPQQAAGNTIVILAEGGHKALDLKCTSNGCILTTMPGGKFQQTQGRVRRSCAFKELTDAPELWSIDVRVYLLWAEGCLRQGPVLDQALHSFYRAQYQIIRYLEMIEAMAGIGCSKWEMYSNWKATFKDFERYPQGGFRCAHDVDPNERNSLNQELWDFYYCSQAGVRRGVSGDVTADYVFRSALGTCAGANGPAPKTARGAIEAAQEMLMQSIKLHAYKLPAPRKHALPGLAQIRTASPPSNPPRLETPPARKMSLKTERPPTDLPLRSSAATTNLMSPVSRNEAPAERRSFSFVLKRPRGGSSAFPQALQEMKRRVQKTVDVVGSKWDRSGSNEGPV